MARKIIACEVMKDELLHIHPQQPLDYDFVSMGLHLHPDKLRRELQRLLNECAGYESVTLAFGLCGGAARELVSPHCPLIIPRIHDCIPLLLGSREAFHRYSAKESGIFYMSCGWMRTDRNILSEHQRIREKYGEAKALSLLNRTYSGYTKLLFIHTGCANDAEVLEQSREMAALLSLEHTRVIGDPSYLQKIVNGPWPAADFIHLAANTPLREEAFDAIS